MPFRFFVFFFVESQILMSSATNPPSGRVRRAELLSAHKSVNQEVSRFVDLDKKVSGAKLKSSMESSSSTTTRVGGTSKYGESLPIDIQGDRHRRAFVEAVKEDPSGKPLDTMLERTMERKSQRLDLERRLQPNMIAIGVQKQPWELQLMMAQRHSDDGDYLSNDFFAMLDSKAVVSDALHRHHSVAEIRSAVTHNFNDWVEQVKAEEPTTRQEVQQRLAEVVKDHNASLDSQRVVEETISTFSQNLAGLNGIGVDLESLSKKTQWAAAHRLKRYEGPNAKTRHVATLTDMTFRIDFSDPCSDDEEDGQAGASSSSHVGSRGMNNEDVISMEEHNHQLLMLEKRLSRRYDAMMTVLQTAESDRKQQEAVVRRMAELVESREAEVIRSRALYEGLLHGSAFTELWEVAQQDLVNQQQGVGRGGMGAGSSSPSKPHHHQQPQPESDPVPSDVLLRGIVEKVMTEMKSELASVNGDLLSQLEASAAVAQRGRNVAASSGSGGGDCEDVAMFRELNALRKQHAEQQDELNSLKSGSDHREELYQILFRKHTTLEQEHDQMEQLLAATEKDRTEKSVRLADVEKHCRELQSRLASFEQMKAEEIAEVHKAYAIQKALLERQVQDLEREVQQLSKATQDEESPEAKLRKALNKIQELEVQQRSLKGLNGALDGKVSDLKDMVQRLISSVAAFLEPFLSHALQMRRHVQGATTEKMIESMRACVWSGVDDVLVDCRNLVKVAMQHSSDPIFPEKIQIIDETMTNGALKPMEEDATRKNLEMELQKVTQNNRELASRYKRLEAELSTLKHSKSQVVDTVRAAIRRMSSHTASATANTVDITDMPVAKEEEEEESGLGDTQNTMDDEHGFSLVESNSFAFGNSFSRQQPSDEGSPDETDQQRHGTFGSQRRGSRRLVRLGSSVTSASSPLPLGSRRQMPLAEGSSLTAGEVEHGPQVTEDPLPEGVVSGKNSVVVENLEMDGIGEGGRRRSVLLDGARRKSLGAMGKLSSLRQRRVSIAAEVVEGDSAFERRDSVVLHPSDSLNIAVPLSPLNKSPLSRQGSVSSLDRNGSPTSSSGPLVGRLFQDSATQQVLDEAFHSMQAQLDLTMAERDSAVAKAALVAKDLNNQLESLSNESSRTLAQANSMSRHMCYSLREISSQFAMAVLSPIEANRQRMWISKEVEEWIGEAKTFPRRATRVLRDLVRETVLHRLRMDEYVHQSQILQQSVVNVGDMMVAAGWKRRMLYCERRHTERIGDLLAQLSTLHVERCKLLQRISQNVEAPRPNPKKPAAPPPQPEPASLQQVTTPLKSESQTSNEREQLQLPPLPVVPDIETADCFTVCDTDDEGLGSLIDAILVDQLMHTLSDAVTQFCETSRVGEYTQALSSGTHSLQNACAVTEGAHKAMGLLSFDGVAARLPRRIVQIGSATLEAMANFQKRIETESYLRFVTPSAPQEEAVATVGGIASSIQGALAALDADEETPAENESDNNQIENQPEHENLVEQVAVRYQQNVAKLETKCAKVEQQLQETKVTLRKILKDVSGDRFVHIETKPHRMNKTSRSPLDCPCPTCLRVIVTQPQERLGHIALPLVNHACTETHSPEEEDDGCESLLRPMPNVSLLNHDRSVSEGFAHQALPAGSPGDHIPDFVPVGTLRSISPVTWNVAGTTNQSADECVPSSTALVVVRSPTEESMCGMGPTARGTASSSTQTDDSLLKSHLLATLDAMASSLQIREGGNQDVTRSPPPKDIFVERSLVGCDPSLSITGSGFGGHFNTAIADRLRVMSSAIRRSIVDEIQSLAPQRGASRGNVTALPSVPPRELEDRTVHRVTQAIIENRRAYTNSNSKLPTGDNDEVVTLCIASAAGSDTHATHRPSMPLGSETISEAIAEGGGIRRVPSADVHRRLARPQSGSLKPLLNATKVNYAEGTTPLRIGAGNGTQVQFSRKVTQQHSAAILHRGLHTATTAEDPLASAHDKTTTLTVQKAQIGSDVVSGAITIVPTGGTLRSQTRE